MMSTILNRDFFAAYLNMTIPLALGLAAATRSILVRRFSLAHVRTRAALHSAHHVQERLCHHGPDAAHLFGPLLQVRAIGNDSNSELAHLADRHARGLLHNRFSAMGIV
jgi:hypothetical protein